MQNTTANSHSLNHIALETGGSNTTKGYTTHTKEVIFEIKHGLLAVIKYFSVYPKPQKKLKIMLNTRVKKMNGERFRSHPNLESYMEKETEDHRIPKRTKHNQYLASKVLSGLFGLV